MKASLPVAITEEITGTLTVSIKLGKEMMAHAHRLGIDLEDLENAAAQKFQEIFHQVAELVGEIHDE